MKKHLIKTCPCGAELRFKIGYNEDGSRSELGADNHNGAIARRFRQSVELQKIRTVYCIKCEAKHLLNSFDIA